MRKKLLSKKQQKARQVLSRKKYRDRIAAENRAKGLTRNGTVRAEPSAFFKEHGMTVPQMAEKLNVSKNTVSRRFNSGQTVVKKRYETAFSKKYGMTLSEAARKVGISDMAIKKRFKLGQDVFAKKKN